MRFNVKDLLQTLWRGAVEVLMFIPIGFIPAVYFIEAPQVWIWIATLPLYYVLGYLAGQLLRPKNIGLVIILLLTISIPINLILPGLGMMWLFSIPIALLLVYRGIKFVSEPWHTYFPVILYVTGLLIYFFSTAILWFIDSFSDYYSTLNTFGIISLIVAFWFLSQANLKKGSLPGKKEAKLASSVMLQNGLWMLLLIGLIFLIVLLSRIRDGFNWIKDQLIALINRFLAWIEENRTGELGEIGSEEFVDPALGEGTRTSLLNAEWLQTFLYIFAIVLIVIVVIGIIMILIKKLPGWVARFGRWLRQTFNLEDKSETESFSDEKEALMDFKKWRKKMTDQIKDWTKEKLEREVKWESLSNSEKVRFLYRHWVSQFIKRGYRYQDYHTPHETKADILSWDKNAPSPNDLIHLYEDVRYGSKEIELNRIEQMKKQIDAQE